MRLARPWLLQPWLPAGTYDTRIPPPTRLPTHDTPPPTTRHLQSTSHKPQAINKHAPAHFTHPPVTVCLFLGGWIASALLTANPSTHPPRTTHPLHTIHNPPPTPPTLQSTTATSIHHQYRSTHHRVVFLGGRLPPLGAALLTANPSPHPHPPPTCPRTTFTSTLHLHIHPTPCGFFGRLACSTKWSCLCCFC